MKCEICKKKTTIDDSVGYDEFIVCNKCHDILIGNYSSTKSSQVMNFIFKCGEIRRNIKNGQQPVLLLNVC